MGSVDKVVVVVLPPKQNLTAIHVIYAHMQLLTIELVDL